MGTRTASQATDGAAAPMGPVPAVGLFLLTVGIQDTAAVPGL